MTAENANASGQGPQDTNTNASGTPAAGGTQGGAPAAPASTPAEGGGTPSETSKPAAEGTPKAGDTPADLVSLGESSSDGAEGETGKPKGEQSADESATDDLDIQLELPEGLELDEQAVGEFKSLAKEVGLNAEGATKLAQWETQRLAQMFEGQKAAIDRQSAAWAQEIAKDAKLGGKNLGANVQAVQRGLKAYGGEEVASLFKSYGLQNHPALFRMFVKLGNDLGEDKSTLGGGGDSPGPLTGDERINNFYS